MTDSRVCLAIKDGEIDPELRETAEGLFTELYEKVREKFQHEGYMLVRKFLAGASVSLEFTPRVDGLKPLRLVCKEGGLSIKFGIFENGDWLSVETEGFCKSQGLQNLWDLLDSHLPPSEPSQTYNPLPTGL